MATSADVISFRLQYSEFKAPEISDPDIASALDDADVWLDADMWTPRDFPTARFLWAAHNLAILMHLLASIESTGSTAMGFTGTFVRMISFGERRVMYERKVAASKAASKLTPGDAALQETWYGQLFYTLRSRNIMPIATV